MTIIGGADGPTRIFLSGGARVTLIAIGVIAVIALIAVIVTVSRK